MYPIILLAMVYTYVQHVLRYCFFAWITVAITPFSSYKGVLLHPTIVRNGNYAIKMCCRCFLDLTQVSYCLPFSTLTLNI